MADQSLTPKQTLFVAEYLKHLNATKAAIDAGYSAANADKIGSELLGKTRVRAAIEAAMGKRADKLELSADRVLKEIASMAFWDPADLIEVVRETLPGDRAEDVQIEPGPDGKIMVITGMRSARDIKFLPVDVRRAVVGWSYDKAGNFTLKLADKSKALDQLARHLSLYNDKLEVNVTDNLADRLARAKQRANGNV